MSSSIQVQTAERERGRCPFPISLPAPDIYKVVEKLEHRGEMLDRCMNRRGHPKTFYKDIAQLG